MKRFCIAERRSRGSEIADLCFSRGFERFLLCKLISATQTADLLCCDPDWIGGSFGASPRLDRKKTSSSVGYKRRIDRLAFYRLHTNYLYALVCINNITARGGD